MKRTPVLLQQNLGRQFKDTWKYQSRKTLIDNGALKQLKLMGIAVEDANEVVRKTEAIIEEITDFPPKPIAMDKNHPDYHSIPCLKFSDHNVLLGGLDQAKVFTNSYEMDDLNTLPNLLDNPSTPPIHNEIVKKIVRASMLFDATQKKLPKRKDPERPAFVFPRDYGITQERKNFLLGKRLIHLCSVLCPQLIGERRISGPTLFQASIVREGKNILLSNTADILISNKNGIQQIIDKSLINGMSLPNIYPLSPLVSFEPHNIYKLEDKFPISENFSEHQVHTVIVHFDAEKVTNLYETEVNESQILGRSLMKSYTFALAQAKQNFGKDVVDLPRPVTVQCIQMDSKIFHFSVLQLNTTGSPEDTNIRNAYWKLPSVHLFESCDYIDGKPELKGYNPLVFPILLKFFQNN